MATSRRLFLTAMGGFALAGPTALPAVGGPPTAVTLATATPGGGFPLFGDAAAEVINATDPTLDVRTRNTKGSLENIPLLEAGQVDIALIAGIPAYEALTGVGRPPTSLRIVAAMYSDFGMFAVRADHPARIVRDLVGQPIAWGTSASGLTAIGKFAMDGIGLDRDRDFKAVFLEKAGDGPALLDKGEVAAIWGGGIGWPNFSKITSAGGRLIGFSTADVEKIVARHSFLSPYTLAPGSYPGQSEPLRSVTTWSVILARADLPDDTAYRLAKSLHAGNATLVAKVSQARETTPQNTLVAARDRTRIHPGVALYLREIGL